MKKSNTTNLVTIMSTVNGTSFISLDLETTPKIRKTLDGEDGKRTPNPHFGRITKRDVGVNARVYQNKNSNGYVNAVKKQMVKEGLDPEDFKLSERKFGTRAENLPIIENKGNYYLEYIVERKGTTQYLLDGQPIDVEDILGYTKPSKPKKSTDKPSNPVPIRIAKLESLVEIRMNKESYNNFVCEF